MKNKTESHLKDAFFMREALRLSQKAFAQREVPVGAVIVKEGRIIARAFNQKEGLQNPLCHAELEAIRIASGKLQSWRLEGCTLFVSLKLVRDRFGGKPYSPVPLHT